MPSLRFKLLGGVIIGLLAVIVSLTMLLGRSHRVAAPRSEPGPAVAAIDSAAPGGDASPAAARPPGRPPRVAPPRPEPGPAVAAIDSAAPGVDASPAAAPARPSRS